MPQTRHRGGSAAELIGRYIQEVIRRLPPNQRADVGRELRSSLLDALEDRFGPEPTWTQAAILLRETGPPARIAASYRPADRYLVGPEWYPTFTRVLRIVLGALAATLVAATAVNLLVRPEAEIGAALLGLLSASFESGLIAFAIVVAVFHLLQRTEAAPARSAERWDPEDLPPARECDVAGRFEAVTGVVVPAAFLAVLYLFRDWLGIPTRGEGPPLLNDLLVGHLPWLAAAIVLGMAVHAWLAWRGRWSWTSRGANLAVDLFALWVLWRIAAGVAARRPELAAAGLPDAASTSVEWTAWSIPLITAAVILVETAKVAVCYLRRPAAAE